MHSLTKGNCSAKPLCINTNLFCLISSATVVLAPPIYIFLFTVLLPRLSPSSKTWKQKQMLWSHVFNRVHYEQAQVVREGSQKFLYNTQQTTIDQYHSSKEYSTSDLVLKHLPRPKHHVPLCNTSHIHPSHLVLYSLLFHSGYF